MPVQIKAKEPLCRELAAASPARVAPAPSSSDAPLPAVEEASGAPEPATSSASEVEVGAGAVATAPVKAELAEPTEVKVCNPYPYFVPKHALRPCVKDHTLKQCALLGDVCPDVVAAVPGALQTGFGHGCHPCGNPLRYGLPGRGLPACLSICLKTC
jgi:hypothetical protein